MELLNFDELWMKLRTGDESVSIEAKLAEEFGKSCFETVSAFSNEPGMGGGYLLLGIGSTSDKLFQEYQLRGVPNAAKVQADVATACRESFSSTIRPAISVETVQGKNMIVVHIPEAKPHEKPVYIKSKGANQGAFRRIGPTDQLCTDDDVALFYQLRDHKTYDETLIDGTDDEDLDPLAIEEYRRTRAALNPSAEELRYSTPDLLYALNAVEKTGKRITIAGLMLFGKQMSLRRHFPLARVDYIRVDGRDWVPDPDERYQTVEMSGPLLTLIPKVVSQVLSDIPKAFSLTDDDIHRKELPLIPRNVIREAIVNALMHRTYRMRQPVQIIRYTNRLDIRNPGHSLVPEDRLGEPGSLTRNEKIAAVLHEVGLAETKGTGIRVMRDAMEDANLTSPIFESSRQKDSFSVTLLTHHLLGPEDIAWLKGFKSYSLTSDEARALIVVREIGAIDNLAYRNINRVDSLTASRHIFRLRDVGLLEQKGKGPNTYYIPTPRLMVSAPSRTLRRASDPLRKDTNPPHGRLDPLGTGLPKALSHLESGPIVLPEHLREAVKKLGERAAADEVKVVIRRLCEWRPLRASELAKLIGRNRLSLRDRYLTPMVTNGELHLLYPDNLSHPRQAYIG
jgi:ATP-dependent DNA helicase RecG